MDEDSLWTLFFATGSPLVWLVLRQRREEERAQTAFHIMNEPKRTV